MSGDRLTVVARHPVTGLATFAVGVFCAPENDRTRAGSIYLTAPGLGCSRDYRSTTERAIQAWFAEHAMSVSRIIVEV